MSGFGYLPVSTNAGNIVPSQSVARFVRRGNQPSLAAIQPQLGHSLSDACRRSVLTHGLTLPSRQVMTRYTQTVANTVPTYAHMGRGLRVSTRTNIGYKQRGYGLFQYSNNAQVSNTVRYFVTAARIQIPSTVTQGDVRVRLYDRRMAEAQEMFNPFDSYERRPGTLIAEPRFIAPGRAPTDDSVMRQPVYSQQWVDPASGRYLKWRSEHRLEAAVGGAPAASYVGPASSGGGEEPGPARPASEAFTGGRKRRFFLAELAAPAAKQLLLSGPATAMERRPEVWPQMARTGLLGTNRESAGDTLGSQPFSATHGNVLTCYNQNILSGSALYTHVLNEDKENEVASDERQQSTFVVQTLHPERRRDDHSKISAVQNVPQQHHSGLVVISQQPDEAGSGCREDEKWVIHISDDDRDCRLELDETETELPAAGRDADSPNFSAAPGKEETAEERGSGLPPEGRQGREGESAGGEGANDADVDSGASSVVDEDTKLNIKLKELELMAASLQRSMAEILEAELRRRRGGTKGKRKRTNTASVRPSEAVGNRHEAASIQAPENSSEQTSAVSPMAGGNDAEDERDNSHEEKEDF